MTADQRVRTLEIVISYIVKITFTLIMRKDHIGDLRDTHTSIAEAFYIVYTVLDSLLPVSVDNALRYVVFVSIFTALEKVKPCEKLIVSLSDFSLRSIVIICAFVLSEHL